MPRRGTPPHRSEAEPQILAAHRLEVRRAVYARSEVWHVLAINELSIADELPALRPPDLSGAYFHAFRALEGFIDRAIIAPVTTVLLTPLAAFLENQNQRARDVLASPFLNQLRDAALRALHDAPERVEPDNGADSRMCGSNQRTHFRHRGNSPDVHCVRP